MPKSLARRDFVSWAHRVRVRKSRTPEPGRRRRRAPATCGYGASVAHGPPETVLQLRGRHQPRGVALVGSEIYRQRGGVPELHLQIIWRNGHGEAAKARHQGATPMETWHLHGILTEAVARSARSCADCRQPRRPTEPSCELWGTPTRKNSEAPPLR